VIAGVVAVEPSVIVAYRSSSSTTSTASSSEFVDSVQSVAEHVASVAVPG
jgi:hypothetical protein